MKSRFLILFVAFAAALPISAAQPRAADEAIRSHYGSSWEKIAQAPSPTKRVIPRYPMNARRRREQAVVKAVFRVDSDGRVERLRCFCETNSAFEDSTYAALVKWRFPKQSGGPYRIKVSYGPVEESGNANLQID